VRGGGEQRAGLPRAAKWVLISLFPFRFPSYVWLQAEANNGTNRCQRAIPAV